MILCGYQRQFPVHLFCWKRDDPVFVWLTVLNKRINGDADHFLVRTDSYHIFYHNRRIVDHRLKAVEAAAFAEIMEDSELAAYQHQRIGAQVIEPYERLAV